MPGLKSTPEAKLPDHQSQADFPGFIHVVSAIFDGGLRFKMIGLAWMSAVGSSPISRTRQGLDLGVEPTPAGSALAQGNRELIEMVADLALGAEIIRPGRVVRFPVRAGQNELASKRRRAQKVQPQRRILEQGFAFVGYAVISPDSRKIGRRIRLELKQYRQRTIRRAHAQRRRLRGGDGRGQNQRGEECQESFLSETRHCIHLGGVLPFYCSHSYQWWFNSPRG